VNEEELAEDIKPLSEVKIEREGVIREWINKDGAMRPGRRESVLVVGGGG
jgi:hypothetical protein